MYLAKIWGMLSQFLFIRVKGLPSVRRQICIDTSRLGYSKQWFLNTKRYNQGMVHFAIVCLIEQLLEFGKNFLIS